MNFTIENECLKVEIDQIGGVLTSIFDKRVSSQLLWQKDPAVWGFQDVVIFPVAGVPAYEIDGATYSCKSRHGFLRDCEFSEVSKTCDSITIEKVADQDTLSQYPFDFCFRITFALDCETLAIKYDISCRDGKTMPFMVGNHAGLSIKNGEANISFDSVQNLLRYPVSADGLCIPQPVAISEIAVSKALFQKYDSVVFSGYTGKELCISDGSGLKIKYACECPCLCIWSNPTCGDYVCMEPWWAMNSRVGEPAKLEDREFVNFTDEKGKSFEFAMKFER